MLLLKRHRSELISLSYSTLILHLFFKLLESHVLLRVREKDQRLIQSILPNVTEEYKKICGKEIVLKIDTETFLSAETCGGIELLSQRGKIKIINTLESRLELIASQLVPEIRIALFGRNPNRKFND